MDWNSVLPAVVGALLGGGGIGAVLSVVFGFLLKKNDQEHRHYQELFERQEERITKLETSHDHCQEENAKLRAEVDRLGWLLRRKRPRERDE